MGKKEALAGLRVCYMILFELVIVVVSDTSGMAWTPLIECCRIIPSSYNSRKSVSKRRAGKSRVEKTVISSHRIASPAICSGKRVMRPPAELSAAAESFRDIQKRLSTRYSTEEASRRYPEALVPYYSMLLSDFSSEDSIQYNTRGVSEM